MRSILYFEEEMGRLKAFEEILRGQYDVRTAQTLAQARRLLAVQRADIVICDQNVPDIEGLKFLAEVARTYPSSYRVLLTGSTMGGEAIHAIGAGIIHVFIQKPWTEQRIRQVLEPAKLYLDFRSKVAYGK